MRNNLPPMVVNPVSLLGAIMAVFSLVIIVVLLLLGATGAVANPYTGILAFMVGPAVLAFGLILIPLGVIRERRRRARYGLLGETFPVLNLNDATQRRGITFFAATTAALLLLMTVTTWGAAEYMESTEFCGKVCHDVMQPEDAAYEASPHARVHCVSCHIGPGAPWLVRSKISGIRQVFAVTLNSYPRPIPVPIEDLRPSRDTCEQCHWPERFYGDRLRNFVHYTDDQQNTLRSQPLVFRVGGSELGAGIHWHTTAKLWYLPLDDKREEIGWVKVERADGSVDEYTLPAKQAEVTPQRIQQDQRFMDCIDCHNRAAHHFEPIESEIDKEMFAGTISPAIPFIKQQAMKAIGTVGEGITQDQYNQAISRINGIEEYYRTQQADAYAKMTPEIKKAVSEIRSTYQRSFFPHMNVTPESYPEWRGHEGCFRCHGKLVGTKGAATGQTVSSACLNCHYPSQVAPPPPTAGEQQVRRTRFSLSYRPRCPIPFRVVRTAWLATCQEHRELGHPGGWGCRPITRAEPATFAWAATLLPRHRRQRQRRQRHDQQRPPRHRPRQHLLPHPDQLRPRQASPRLHRSNPPLPQPRRPAVPQRFLTPSRAENSAPPATRQRDQVSARQAAWEFRPITRAGQTQAARDATSQPKATS